MADLFLPVSFAGSTLGVVGNPIELPTSGPASADPDGTIYQIHADDDGGTANQPLKTITGGNEADTLVASIGPVATPYLQWAGPALARGPLRGRPAPGQVDFDAPRPNPLA